MLQQSQYQHQHRTSRQISWSTLPSDSSTARVAQLARAWDFYDLLSKIRHPNVEGSSPSSGAFLLLNDPTFIFMRFSFGLASSPPLPQPGHACLVYYGLSLCGCVVVGVALRSCERRRRSCHSFGSRESHASQPTMCLPAHLRAGTALLTTLDWSYRHGQVNIQGWLFNAAQHALEPQASPTYRHPMHPSTGNIHKASHEPACYACKANRIR